MKVPSIKISFEDEVSEKIIEGLVNMILWFANDILGLTIVIEFMFDFLEEDKEEENAEVNIETP